MVYCTDLNLPIKLKAIVILFQTDPKLVWIIRNKYLVTPLTYLASHLCWIRRLHHVQHLRYKSSWRERILPPTKGNNQSVRKCQGGDLTFLISKICRQIPCPRQIISVNCNQISPPGLHIAVHPKARLKKGTIKISPNKTLQSLFTNVTTSPKIRVPVKAAIIRFNHSIRILKHCIEYRNL